MLVFAKKRHKAKAFYMAKDGKKNGETAKKSERERLSGRKY